VLAAAAAIAVALLTLGRAPALAGETASNPGRACLFPYLGSADPGPQCFFDIWGYVTNASGQPIANAVVYDGHGTETATDATGLYRLPEDQPNSYGVWVGVPGAGGYICHKTVMVVDPNASTAMYRGGARQDIQMPCG
jgi:hypothetical protein